MNKLETLRDQILSQNPTDQQKDAIFAEELEFLLRASPGSGKTWTSCRRFIWRGANWSHAAGGLALLSFTNAAIREFHEATIEVGRRDLLSDPNFVGTFDAFVERFILSPFGHLIIGSSKRPKLFIAPRPGDWNNKKLIVWTELKGGKKRQVPAWEIIPYPDDGKVAFRASITFGGNKLQFAVHNPVNELLRLGFYTHAQRVFWACRLLFDRPHIAELIARRFPEIIVDEAQDTNVWLLILLNFLREKGTKIALIGDPDQCIYEFSMADATSLPALREKWKIPEKPLSQSFRCNNQIAAAVRNIGGNSSFAGCGDGKNEHRRPIVIREPAQGFAHSIAEFQRALERAGIDEAASAILCRAHQQLESIRGEVNYTNLQGQTKDLAQASFFRDCRKDYKRAFQIVESSVRSMAEDSDIWERVDEYPESDESQQVKLAIWRFVKAQSGLPAVSLSGSEWISQLRQSLGKLLTELGIKNVPNLGQKIRKTGLDDSQLGLPLFTAQTLFPPIRQETIHQVKGESIDAVLVLGSTKFFNAVVDSVSGGESSEERRVAYVAMTRARHLLAVGLPAAHFDKHSKKWVEWGFRTL
jgi:superfamily I DNA/RNA helicase